jgi:hypothetical protein
MSLKSARTALISLSVCTITSRLDSVELEVFIVINAENTVSQSNCRKSNWRQNLSEFIGTVNCNTKIW